MLLLVLLVLGVNAASPYWRRLFRQKVSVDKTGVPGWRIFPFLRHDDDGSTASARPADSGAPSLWRVLPSSWQVAADQTVKNTAPDPNEKCGDIFPTTTDALILPPGPGASHRSRAVSQHTQKHTETRLRRPSQPSRWQLHRSSLVHVGRKAECGLPTRPSPRCRTRLCPDSSRVTAARPASPSWTFLAVPRPDDDAPLGNTAASSSEPCGQPCPATHVHPADRTRQAGVFVDTRCNGGQHESRPNHACFEVGARVDCGVISRLAKARLTTTRCSSTTPSLRVWHPPPPSHRSLPACLSPRFQSWPCAGRVCVESSPFPSSSAAALPCVQEWCWRVCLSLLV
ncbi:hypothetical protein QBC39DRAFT_344643 [Podospora conica]|nr:hypothetical protein QBC39DRAFT_344643 [Schizothecium conicum]